eukprot:ANDGO_02290.mRNA.1 hypothetical protein
METEHMHTHSTLVSYTGNGQDASFLQSARLDDSRDVDVSHMNASLTASDSEANEANREVQARVSDRRNLILKKLNRTLSLQFNVAAFVRKGGLEELAKALEDRNKIVRMRALQLFGKVCLCFPQHVAQVLLSEAHIRSFLACANDSSRNVSYEFSLLLHILSRNIDGRGLLLKRKQQVMEILGGAHGLKSPDKAVRSSMLAATQGLMRSGDWRNVISEQKGLKESIALIHEMEIPELHSASGEVDAVRAEMVLETVCHGDESVIHKHLKEADTLLLNSASKLRDVTSPDSAAHPLAKARARSSSNASGTGYDGGSHFKKSSRNVAVLREKALARERSEQQQQQQRVGASDDEGTEEEMIVDDDEDPAYAPSDVADDPRGGKSEGKGRGRGSEAMSAASKSKKRMLLPATSANRARKQGRYGYSPVSYPSDDQSE